MNCHKRCYATKGAARRAMKATQTHIGDGRPGGKVYRCSSCGAWHWGHRKPEYRKSESRRAERHLSLVEPTPTVAAPRVAAPRKPRCVKCGRWWMSDLDWTSRSCPWPCGGELALVRQRVAA